MEFSHKIILTFAPDGTVTAKHVCETVVDVKGKDATPESVSTTRFVPVGGKTLAAVTEMMKSLRAVNEEAMETICRHDALQIAHAVTVRDAKLAKTRGVIGIDTDTTQENEDGESGAAGDRDHDDVRKSGGGGKPGKQRKV